MRRLGLADQATTYEIDKQQGPPVQHRILSIQYPVINHSGEEYKKECIGKTESLYCIAEINTTS